MSTFPFTPSVVTHDWMRRINVAYVPGAVTPLLEQMAQGMLQQFNALGHTVQSTPDNTTLHGHRGVSAYNRELVEYVPLAAPYLRYFVTCGTDAQARGVRDAFSRSEAMRNPDDPRQLAFTILPGHGVVIAEKWITGKEPFQVIWEAMDAGHLVIDSGVPQSLFGYLPGEDGRMSVVEAT